MPTESGDYFDRSVKGPSPLSSTIFIGLRWADLPLQYYLLQRGWGASIIQRLGGQPVHLGTGGGILSLAPYHTAVCAMALGSTVKHTVYQLVVLDTKVPVSIAALIGTMNSIINSMNTLLSLWTVTSLAPVPPSLPSSSAFYIGVGLYSIGILTELVAELQRKRFKSDPLNKGKPYFGGLWSLATNINYGGYILWRAGYALACGGVSWGLFCGSLHFIDFAFRAVPAMERYCTKRVCPVA